MENYSSIRKTYRKPDNKPEVKLDVKPENKPNVKPATKPAEKPQSDVVSTGDSSIALWSTLTLGAFALGVTSKQRKKVNE